MPNGLTVSPEVLKERAGEIRKQIQNMGEILERVNQEFAKVPDSYQGEASNTLLNQYNSLKTKYNDFTEAMNSYATFLESTGQAYANMASNLASKAEEYLDI